MRSVFVFTAVEPQRVRECLDGIGQRGSADDWAIDSRLVVYVSSPPNWLDGFDDVRADIERELGGNVSLVVADVSGNIDGTSEAREFALAILALGPGLAFDDHASRGWTANDLTTDKTSAGRNFFSGSSS